MNTLPEKFIAKLKKIVNPEHFNEVLDSFSYRKPSTFRANTLKISAEGLREKLRQQGIEAEQVSWYKDAFILKNIPQKILTGTELYKQGYLYVQGLSSMIPPLILNPKAYEKILDICAAPGSKITQMAMLMENKGEIIANDKSRVRNFRLKANIDTQGVTIAKISQTHGETLWKKFPSFFDKILVDVPCSMEGRFYREDEKTYRDWTLTKVKILSGVQKILLRSAITCTKPGGIIVYSTCTLSPEENEEIIDWILKKEGNSIDIEEIQFPTLNTAQKIENNSNEDSLFIPGLKRYQQKVFDPRLSKTKRILPSKIMEGFYIAKLKKSPLTPHYR